MSRLRKSRRREERVARYEAKLHALYRLMAAGPATKEALAAARPLANALTKYYASEDWKRDFAADEAGLLPPELPRGVLSEDGIYNALEACVEWLAEGESEAE